MKIYTRTGDTGETSLLAGGRINKGHARLHACGTVDELNAVLGLVRAARPDPTLDTPLRRVQAELFTVGADLATPLGADAPRIVRVAPDLIATLERELDTWEAQLPELRQFILPGGGMVGAYLHQARTVCRRAERWAVTLKGLEAINGEVLRYLNRLSDWLFVAARLANLLDGKEEARWEGPQA